MVSGNGYGIKDYLQRWDKDRPDLLRYQYPDEYGDYPIDSIAQQDANLQ